MSPLRLVGAAALVVAAPLWIVPSDAFGYADVSPRGVVATVVGDAVAYVAITGGECDRPVTGGGTCAFTITNRGTEARSYSVTKLSDASPTSVSSYQVTGGSSVGSGATHSGTVNVGNSVTLTAQLTTCVPLCSGSKTSTWRIEAKSATQTLAIREGFPMTVTYQ